MTPSTQRSPARYVALAVAGVGIAVVLGKSIFAPTRPVQPESVQTSAPGSTLLPASRSIGLTPQPPGPAPAGKVWSPEHGHWHDTGSAGAQADGTSSTFSVPEARTQTLTPQPPGPVPEGKVWSPEHGHWHDLPAATTPAATTPAATTPAATTPATATPATATPQPAAAPTPP